jgi:hypothetical protein
MMSHLDPDVVVVGAGGVALGPFPPTPSGSAGVLRRCGGSSYPVDATACVMYRSRRSRRIARKAMWMCRMQIRIASLRVIRRKLRVARSPALLIHPHPHAHAGCRVGMTMMTMTSMADGAFERRALRPANMGDVEEEECGLRSRGGGRRR